MRRHPDAPATALSLADLFAFDLYEAERRSSLSRSTLRRAIASGELRAAKVFNTVRIRAIDLDDWLRRAAGSDLPAIVPATVDVGNSESAQENARSERPTPAGDVIDGSTHQPRKRHETYTRK